MQAPTHLRTDCRRATESPAARVTRFKVADRRHAAALSAVDSSSRYRPRRRRRDVGVAATATTADFGQRAGAAAGEETGGGRQVIWSPRVRSEMRMIALAMMARARPRSGPGTIAAARRFAARNDLLD